MKIDKLKRINDLRKEGKNMLKQILIISAVVMVVLLVFTYYIMKGSDLSKFEYLKEPQIISKADQKMLVVEIKGDPNLVAGKAFSALYATYYKLKDNPKSFHLAPRARWPLSSNLPKDQWLGRYALPISETAKFPADFKQSDPSMKVEVQNWEYGNVAEILHIGPYDKEKPAIERLHNFIKKKGYRIIGEHEEEYLKGPGMFGKGDPNRYYTIIRLRIAK